jgi:hypothetical protein
MTSHAPRLLADAKRRDTSHKPTYRPTASSRIEKGFLLVHVQVQERCKILIFGCPHLFHMPPLIFVVRVILQTHLPPCVGTHARVVDSSTHRPRTIFSDEFDPWVLANDIDATDAANYGLYDSDDHGYVSRRYILDVDRDGREVEFSQQVLKLTSPEVYQGRGISRDRRFEKLPDWVWS